MKKLINTLGLFIFIILMVRCDENLSKGVAYNFTGDSIIARWALGESFPSQLVYNHGKSGAGIDFIESQYGRFAGQNVVVMVGTNDFNYFVTENFDGYIIRYLSAIAHLTDKTIYLYSVLPRDFAGDPSDINEIISGFNKKVRAGLSSFPNIVYMNVYEKFMDGPHINYQYFSDGLHLNSYGYQILATEFLRTID